MRDIKEFPHQKYEGFLHPSPKSRYLWYYILNKLKPSSVIDPFLGSGTTAEVCTKLGIPFLGYEINEVYSQDIEKRLKGCKREPKQVSLESY
jgi:site-specific DNA-methyltransferase (adenine-specific)